MMTTTYDIHVKGYEHLVAPGELKDEFSLTPKATETVLSGRKIIEAILDGKDKRMMAITGPCSIHDERSAIEYAERLLKVNEKVKDTLFLVMRVYFEKPRTNVGWKGLINDPDLNGTCDIQKGLKKARKLLLDISEMGVPIATEILEPIIPQYIAGLISWAAIGARTTESQTHREMASGLSMPVGFKNHTNGDLGVALNAMQAARAEQTFLGIDQEGRSCIVRTTGNPYGHLVMRGGKRPNYDPVSIADAAEKLRAKNLPTGIVVDCSHGNSGKKYQGQSFVWKSVISQRLEGNEDLVGLMLESNLKEGNQKIPKDLSQLEYGVSVTDECIGWETTEDLLMHAHDKLSKAS